MPKQPKTVNTLLAERLAILSGKHRPSSTLIESVRISGQEPEVAATIYPSCRSAEGFANTHLVRANEDET